MGKSIVSCFLLTGGVLLKLINSKVILSLYNMQRLTSCITYTCLICQDCPLTNVVFKNHCSFCYGTNLHYSHKHRQNRLKTGSKQIITIKTYIWWLLCAELTLVVFAVRVY